MCRRLDIGIIQPRQHTASYMEAEKCTEATCTQSHNVPAVVILDLCTWCHMCKAAMQVGTAAVDMSYSSYKGALI